MDTMTFTKAAAAFCGALLVFLLGMWAAETLYSVRGTGEQAYVIETGDDEGSAEQAEEEETGPDIIEVMASADPGAGEGVFRRCQACHNVEDGANATGPHLYAVVGRDIAAVDGFGYSDALSGMDGAWTVENLNAFLENPSDYASGTSMSFAGLRDIEDRANVIAYLDSTDGEMTDYAALAEEPAPAGDDDDTDAAAEAEADAAGQEEAAVESDADAAAEDETTEGAADAAAEEEAAAEGAADAEEAAAEGEADAATEEETAEGAADATAEEEAATAGEADATTDDETAESEMDAGAEEQAVASASDGAILANADPEAGERVFRQCQACHKVEDGRNGVGPHLYGVVGREIAAVEDYSYSDALSGKDGVWDAATLDAYLTNPREWAPGTKMTYAGLRKDEDRANVIAYLDSVED